MLGQPHPITFCYFYETGGANKGKAEQVVVTAIARELCAFCGPLQTKFKCRQMPNHNKYSKKPRWNNELNHNIPGQP
jgi:hypothetical protein